MAKDSKDFNYFNNCYKIIILKWFKKGKKAKQSAKNDYKNKDAQKALQAKNMLKA